jgi:ribosome-binding ATPase YchF (GTP1/OBG family)
VIALNKIDHADADKNIAKLAKMYPSDRLVLTSAISEVFLRKLVKQGYVKYTEGTEFVDTYEDLVEQGDETGGGLKPMDEKLKARLENMRDLVLFRFGGTGVVDVLSRAGQMLGLTPVFPVRSVQAGFGGEGKDAKVFRDCLLVKRGTTVGDVFRKVMGDVPLAYVDTVGGVRVSEDDVIVAGKNDVSSKRGSV